jgi:hypothetical protein
MPMSPEERVSLSERLQSDYSSEVLWTKAWSSVHHTFLFGAAILSFVAALAIELEFEFGQLTPKRTGVLMAGLAGLAGTIAASGGFGRKWKTNRRTRGRLRALLTDCTAPDADGDDIRKRLNAIWAEHDEGIVGPE